MDDLDTALTNQRKPQGASSWLSANWLAMIAIAIGLGAIAISVVALTRETTNDTQLATRINEHASEIAFLKNPTLNRTTAEMVVEGTISLQTKAYSFTVFTTPPNGLRVDTAWNGTTYATWGTCRLMEFIKGGIRYGVIEVDPITTYTVASATTTNMRLEITIGACTASRIDASKVSVSEPKGIYDKFSFSGVPTLSNPEGATLPRVIADPETGELEIQAYNHNSACGAVNAICNTIPEGVTWQLSKSYRYLREISYPDATDNSRK